MRRPSGKSSLEVAVSWGWGVDAAFGALGDELEGDGAGRNGALVSDEVDVVSSMIDEAHALGVDVGSALGIVASVLGHSAFGDDDQAVTRVGVPAGGSAGLPDIALDVQVGRAFGALQGHPELFVFLSRGAAGEVAGDIDFAESAHGERGAFVPFRQCCRGISGVIESRGRDGGKE